MIEIGLISDTHKLLRPEAIEALRGCSHIVHAGDIGDPGVIEALAKLAPVTAIRGNVDKGEWASAYAEVEVLEVEGRSIYILHNLNEIDLDPIATGFDVVVSGHSHKPDVHSEDGVLYVNPGSAGPRRFSLPICVGRLVVDVDSVRAELIELPHS